MIHRRMLWAATAASMFFVALLLLFIPPVKVISVDSIAMGESILSGFSQQGSRGHSSFDNVLRAFYTPFVPALDTPTWVDFEGREYYITEEPAFIEPLRGDVLILDVDNRPGSNEGEIGFPGRLDFSHIKRVSAGMLNHMMYASIHGYDYQFARPTYHIDRHATWYKLPAILEGLKTHRIVVFLDADAIFVNMELPLEWLMNHWNVTSTTALTIARDPPNGEQNKDLWGSNNVNAGFMIFQQHELVGRMFEAWMDCPNGKHYPLCKQFAYGFPHEQGAMSSFVRYDYGDIINEIPCDEANGFPSEDIAPACNGHLVRHRWVGKANIQRDMTEQLARVTFERIHQRYLDHEEDFLQEYPVAPENWKIGP